MKERLESLTRETAETSIEASVNLDGSGRSVVSTGLGFLDHMLATLARHSGFDIELRCKGDLEVDDHHSAEDCALALGACIDGGLGERRGIARFGWAYAPLDEALARAVIDLSGRPYARVELGLQRESIGKLACENLTHFLSSLATAARACLHIDVIEGANDHHRAEAAFKALAQAIAAAVAPGCSEGAPSTKGVL